MKTANTPLSLPALQAVMPLLELLNAIQTTKTCLPEIDLKKYRFCKSVVNLTVHNSSIFIHVDVFTGLVYLKINMRF